LISWRTTDFSRSELFGVETWMQQDVRQELRGERQVLVEHLDVEAGVLLRGEGVHLPATESMVRAISSRSAFAVP